MEVSRTVPQLNSNNTLWYKKDYQEINQKLWVTFLVGRAQHR